MTRTDIINSLIEKIKARTYLEIGVSSGVNFDQIKCPFKIGIDPNPNSKATIQLSSDKFFLLNTQAFDIIFIDGLHHYKQVYRDIENSLRWLNPNGYIICHDMLPPSEEYQVVPPVQNLWTGDCWKAWVQIRQDHDNLKMHTVDTDYGCGIISKGEEPRLKVYHELTWDTFSEHKQEWMNIISVDQFKELYLS